MEIEKSLLEMLPNPAFSNLISFLTPQEACRLEVCSSEIRRKIEKCRMYISMDLQSYIKRQLYRNKRLLPVSKPLWITVWLCIKSFLDGICCVGKKVEPLLKKAVHSSTFGKVAVYLSIAIIGVGVGLIALFFFSTVSLLCSILFYCSRTNQKIENFSKKSIKEILSYPRACTQLYDFFKEDKRFVDAQTEHISFFDGNTDHFNQFLIPFWTGQVKWLATKSWKETSEIINSLPIYKIPFLLDDYFEKLKQINHPIHNIEEFKTYIERCL